LAAVYYPAQPLGGSNVFRAARRAHRLEEFHLCAAPSKEPLGSTNSPGTSARCIEKLPNNER
jgi:hypothetical protein